MTTDKSLVIVTSVIIRRPTEYVGDAKFNLNIPGPGRRGTAKLSWLSVIKKDMVQCQLTEEDVNDSGRKQIGRRNCKECASPASQGLWNNTLTQKTILRIT